MVGARSLRRVGNLFLIGTLFLAFVYRAATATEVDKPPLQEYFTVKPPGSMDYRISHDRFIINAQVQLALQREMRALLMVSKSTAPESLATTREVIKDGYVLLRTATHGLDEAIKVSKYPEPLLKLYRDKVMEIRLQLVDCMADLQSAEQGDGNRIGPATERLKWSVERLKKLVRIMSKQ